MKKRSILILLALVAVVVWPVSTHAQVKPSEKPIELRLAHMMPVGSPSHQHIELWAKRIAADSNGRLTIRIFPSNTLIPGPEIYNGVVNGTADIGFSWRYKPEGFGIGVTFPFILAADETDTTSFIISNDSSISSLTRDSWY